MKVWLATSGEYSDFSVVKVFAREEDAIAYELADNVEEREVHEGPVPTRNVVTLVWHSARSDGTTEPHRNPWIDNDRKDVDDSPGVKHRWVPGRPGMETYLVVEGWDAEGVMKVYSEQRAQHIARQDAVPAVLSPGRSTQLRPDETPVQAMDRLVEGEELE